LEGKVMKKTLLALLVVVAMGFAGKSTTVAAENDAPLLDDLVPKCDVATGWVAQFCGKTLEGRFTSLKNETGNYARLCIESVTAEGITVYYSYGRLGSDSEGKKRYKAQLTKDPQGGSLKISFGARGLMTLTPEKGGLKAALSLFGPSGSSWWRATLVGTK
jgi:hypothetical protein